MRHVRAFTWLLAGLAATVLSGQGRPAPSASADFVSAGPALALPAPLRTAMHGLAAPALSTHIVALSAPGFEGRGLGQPGLEASAEYVAAMLSLGRVPPLSPPPVRGASGVAAYFQPVPVREITDPGGQVIVEVRRGAAVDSRSLMAGVDCLFEERTPLAVAGGVVFAGHGIREPTLSWDDYRSVTVTDRIVVVVAGTPREPAWQQPALQDRYARGRRPHEAKAELAHALGARALVVIEDEAFSERLVEGTGSPAPRFFTPYDVDAGYEGRVPIVRVSRAAGRAMLAAAGVDVEAAPAAPSRALTDLHVTVRITGRERLVMSRNVVAMLPGSDPALRDQAVVIGAHFDHLGRADGRIHPGADDNASGTSALLEIARVLASSPIRPKRSVVLAFWTGEEEGHLGSEHYVRHPLWPLERTAVYLNLDMIGHPWTASELRELVTSAGLEQPEAFLAGVKVEDFIELGVPDGARDLDQALTTAARGVGMALHLDRFDGRSGGSDYRAFARRGRPFIRFFGNYFDGYHEPTDTADRVAPEQVLKVARLALASAWLLADR